MALCDDCMLVDPRSMVSVDDDADTNPIDVPVASRLPRWLAPVVAFVVALLSRCASS